MGKRFPICPLLYAGILVASPSGSLEMFGQAKLLALTEDDRRPLTAIGVRGSDGRVRRRSRTVFFLDRA